MRQALLQASASLRQSQYDANHDSLTGLPNRNLFYHFVAQQLALYRRNTGEFCILFIDLDGFKAVNDTYGHAAGDQLLRDVSIRIGETCRASDIAARLGGDEFALALAYTGLDQARTLASRLLEQLSAPYPIGTVRATITASIGISHFPGTANDVDTLMRKADHAMYSAKAAGKRCVVWSQRARPLSSKLVPTMDRPAARQPLTSYIISSGGIQPACSLPFRALPQYSGPP